MLGTLFGSKKKEGEFYYIQSSKLFRELHPNIDITSDESDNSKKSSYKVAIDESDGQEWLRKKLTALENNTGSKIKVQIETKEDITGKTEEEKHVSRDNKKEKKTIMEHIMNQSAVLGKRDRQSKRRESNRFFNQRYIDQNFQTTKEHKKILTKLSKIIGSEITNNKHEEDAFIKYLLFCLTSNFGIPAISDWKRFNSFYDELNAKEKEEKNKWLSDMFSDYVRFNNKSN
tara:strand:+ start:838 stop:1527 length:690 start_codon:yes stop_codon:yes gene_type:complete